MPPKTVRVKPVKNANASAGGGKAAAASAAGKGGKSAKSTASSKPAAAPVAGKKTASAAAPKSNMVREVKPMTPVTPRVKEEKEEETEDPPSYVQHENMMYNEYGLDGRRILSPEPSTRWGRYWKRARKAYRATAFYRKKRELKQRWRDYREKKRQ